MSLENDYSAYRELRLLMAEAMGGTITNEQVEKLEEILKSEASARRYYREYLRLYTDLDSLFNFNQQEIQSINEEELLGNSKSIWRELAKIENEAPAIKIQRPEQEMELKSIQKEKLAPFSNRVNKGALTATILLAAALFFMIAYVQFFKDTPALIGQVTKLVNAEWSVTQNWLQEGDDLFSGPIQLQKGYVEIFFKSGAKVLLEGPAEVELESPRQFLLRSGKIVANVPKEAIGFTVRTPQAAVVDYGTEFGVVVNPNGTTEAHVFEGMVDLRTGSNPVHFEKHMKLKANQAGRISQDGDIRKTRIRRDLFARTIPSPYEIAIKRSRPLSYFRFDPAQKIFYNMYDSFGIPADIQGSVSSTNSIPHGGNKNGSAICFSGPNSHAVIKGHAQNRSINPDEFSVLLWIRPDVIRQQVILFQEGLGTRFLNMTANGTISHYYFLPNSKTSLVFIETHQKIEQGRWCQIAYTVKRSGLKHLYINGTEAARPVDAGEGGKLYDHLFIGAASSQFNIEKIPSFKGAIGEITTYDRELSPQEIKQIYHSALNP